MNTTRRQVAVFVLSALLTFCAVACGLLPGYPPAASAAVAQRGLSFDTAITTGANIFSADVVAPSTAPRAIRIMVVVKAGATDSTMIARWTSGARTNTGILNSGDACVAGRAYTFVVEVPAGYSFNIRPGTNTTSGIITAVEVTGDVL
jgi:hypothetical protein